MFEAKERMSVMMNKIANIFLLGIVKFRTPEDTEKKYTKIIFFYFIIYLFISVFTDMTFLFDAADASPVKNLQCEGPNKANAEIVLSWTSPTGQHSGFQVTVNHGEIDNISSTCCNHTVSNLRHYTEYLLTVKTLSCGEPSTPVSQDCWTGITSRMLCVVNILIKCLLNSNMSKHDCI